MVGRRHTNILAALIAVATLLLSAAAAAAKDIELNIPNVGKGKLKISVKPAPEQPKATNPYEGKSYGGCPGGFCPPDDAELEHQFWHAADAGNAKLVTKLLSNKKLNISRNIVPDDQGLARVIDVAVWAAAYKGHKPVMKVRPEGSKRQ